MCRAAFFIGGDITSSTSGTTTKTTFVNENILLSANGDFQPYKGNVVNVVIFGGPIFNLLLCRYQYDDRRRYPAGPGLLKSRVFYFEAEAKNNNTNHGRVSSSSLFIFFNDAVFVVHK